MADVMSNIQKVMNEDLKKTSSKSEQRENERILKAASGRGTGGGGVPRTSTLGEQIELGKANAILDNTKAGAEMAINQLKQQESRVNQMFDETQNNLIKAREKAQNQFNQKVDSILQHRKNTRVKLDFSKDQADIEEAAFLLRLQNAKYIQTLNNTAKEAQLFSDLRFKEESARTILGQNLNAKIDQLGFSSALNKRKREQQLELARMGANDALEMAMAALEDAKAEQAWGSVGQLGAAGLGAAVEAGWFSSDPEITGPQGGPTIENAGNAPIGTPLDDLNQSYSDNFFDNYSIESSGQVSSPNAVGMPPYRT